MSTAKTAVIPEYNMRSREAENYRHEKNSLPVKLGNREDVSSLLF